MSKKKKITVTNTTSYSSYNFLDLSVNNGSIRRYEKVNNTKTNTKIIPINSVIINLLSVYKNHRRILLLLLTVFQLTV